MSAKKKTKTKAIQPRMPKRDKEEDMAKSKRSVIVHKREEKIENLYQALGEIERTIQELSRIYAELPESRHRGLSGQMKQTEKQKMIQKQLEQALLRANKLLKIIEKVEN